MTTSLRSGLSFFKNASLAEASLGLSRLQKERAHAGGVEALARAGTSGGLCVRAAAPVFQMGDYKAEPREDVHALLTVAADGLAARQWRDMWGRARRRRRARSSSPRCAGGWASSSAASSHATASAGVPYIGVPRAVVERRMQRGQLIGGPQARVPLYVPYADFFQYQAGAGRLAGRA